MLKSRLHQLITGKNWGPTDQAFVNNNPGSSFWRRRLPRISRWLHIYLSMLSFVIIFFFAVTGLTLNHAEHFANKILTVQGKGNLNMKWVNTRDTSSVAKLEIVEYLRSKHNLKGALSDFRTDESQCDVSFKGPGYAADIFINRQTGDYDISQTSAGFIGVMNDLHKGRDAGPIWSVVIDISAILMTLVSLTGMVLLLYLKRKRISGLILAAMGLIIAYFVYVMWVR